MKPLIRTSLIGALPLLGICLPAAAAVTAALEKQQVAPGDTVQLILRKDGSGGGDPDLAPLKQDFDVLRSSTGPSVQFVNGSMSAQRELRLTLAPKHSGTLQVPPLNWGGEKTEPLSLTVSDTAATSDQPAQRAGATAAPVLLTTSLDQKQPYVQGAVVLKVQIHFVQPLYQASLDLEGNNDVQVRQLGEDRQSSEIRNGHRYDVIERQYLLQPLRSGSISLEGPTLDGQVADSSRDPFGANSPFADAFGNSPFAGVVGGRRQIRLHGDPIVLDVRPRPSAAKGRDWLPAKELKLAQGWRPDNTDVHVGEPLTLHLGITASGLTAAQLPDLSAELQLPDGLKAYPDQAKLDTSLKSGEIVASREQDIALIAGHAGHYRIPALHLNWWDVQQNLAREAVLPEREFDILPAVGNTAEPTVAAAAEAPAATGDAVSTPPDESSAAPQGAVPSRTALSPWAWVSIALGVLWLSTVAAWWYRSRHLKVEPTAAVPKASTNAAVGTLRRAFLKACQDNDAKAARHALLTWARVESPDNPPIGLTAIARLVGDPVLSELLAQLDRACYADGNWQGSALAQALSVWPGTTAVSRKHSGLSPLYP
jgi:hypothetical protein